MSKLKAILALNLPGSFVSRFVAFVFQAAWISIFSLPPNFSLGQRWQDLEAKIHMRPQGLVRKRFDDTRVG
jgi:hypothetical protein